VILRLPQRFLRRNISRRDNGGQNEPIFLASRPPCRSVGAGCNCDPCLRLATGERACLCVGGCDDGCCCGHSHTGAFSFSRHGLIACRAKPSPTQPPEQPACARMVRSCRRHARLDASPERPCVLSQGTASVAALPITTEVMVAKKPTRPPHQCPTEARPRRVLTGCIGPRVSAAVFL
jgi:hypothetical protein